MTLYRNHMDAPSALMKHESAFVLKNTPTKQFQLSFWVSGIARILDILLHEINSFWLYVVFRFL